MSLFIFCITVVLKFVYASDKNTDHSKSDHNDNEEGGGVTTNFFSEFETLLSSSDPVRAEKLLFNDMLGGYDTPKEITITCPTEPIVSIKDIVEGSDPNKCSVISMVGPNFNFLLEVNCNDD